MTARKRAEQPEPVEDVEPEGPTDEPTSPEVDEVAPIVDGAPVSSAARHNVRYGDIDTSDDPADADAT